MRILIYIIIFFFGIANINAQKNINLIIAVDENIAIGQISGIKLVGVFNEGGIVKFKADYYPGNLSVSNEDYKRLVDTSIKTVHLLFDYTESYNGATQTYTYDIDLKKGWLTHYYYIVYVYNTFKRKYKKLFVNASKEKYVYEFDYPGGSTKLIRKRE